MEHDLNMMLRTPVAHSPNQSTGSALEHEVTRVKVTNSGASTPTLTLRGDPARMSLASKRSEFDDEFLVNKVDFHESIVDRGGGGDHVRASATLVAGAGNGNIGPLRESNGEATGMTLASSEKEAFFQEPTETTTETNKNVGRQEPKFVAVLPLSETTLTVEKENLENSNKIEASKTFLIS